MINQGQINLYWVQKFRPDLRKKADEIAAAVQIHSRKVTPDALLDTFRPNETPDAKKYRKSVYKPKTFGWFNKVTQQFAKIRRAEDWRVEWPANLATNPVREYTQGNFGAYNTVENWFFNFYMRWVVDDPNGAWVVLPENIERILTGEDQLNPLVPFKPKIFYFPSSVVRDYTEGLLVIDGLEFDQDPVTGQKIAGRSRPVQYLFDRDQVVKLVQTQSGNNPQYSVFSYTHRLGFTAGLNGGLIADDEQKDQRQLYWSFIEPALPFWAEAIEIESDHRVNLALHIHPDRWEITSETCTNQVNGAKCEAGKIKMRVGRTVSEVNCEKCSGTGKVSVKTPFGVTKVRPQKGGLNGIEYGPTPPMGYAERPHETIKIVKQLADDNIRDGLAALNLEVLVEGTRLAQSGTAKAMDNQEAENFVAQFAQHAVENLFNNWYYFIALWMQPQQTDDQRRKMLPTLNTPRKFDLVTTEAWIARVAAYKADGAAAAQAEAEIKLAERQYGAESTAYKRIRDSILFDPLYGKTDDEKSLVSIGGGCTRQDYVLSCKIGYFLTRAGAETKNAFFDFDFAKKVETLTRYVNETVAPAGALATALGGQQADPAAPGAAADTTAALRGSVGGSGIIRQLRLDVAQGTTSKDAAIFQLMTQLGYDEATAAKLIGNPPAKLQAATEAGTIVPAAMGVEPTTSLTFAVGDRVVVRPESAHVMGGVTMGGAGTVEIVNGTAYGIRLDNMPDEIHKWYTAEELQPEGNGTKKKKPGKPAPAMAGM